MPDMFLMFLIIIATAFVYYFVVNIYFSSGPLQLLLTVSEVQR